MKDWLSSILESATYRIDPDDAELFNDEEVLSETSWIQGLLVGIIQ